MHFLLNSFAKPLSGFFQYTYALNLIIIVNIIAEYSINNKNIVLASGSSRRFHLLKKLEFPFTVHVSSIKEVFDSSEKPEKVCQKLAFQKAEDVSSHHHNAIIIGADTLVALNEEMIGKPATRQEAEKTLLKLSGKTHRVITGVALIKTTKEAKVSAKQLFYDKTFVTFGKISTSMIKKYVNSGNPMDKAGAYGIQDNWSAAFVEKIEGNYNNVVGLPTYKLYRQLKNFTVND